MLAGAAVAAAVVNGGAQNGVPAAKVGRDAIPASAVERETAAIMAQPAYSRALGAASTLALAAPVDPKAVASASGDPDDLRVSFGPADDARRPYTAADMKAGVLTRLIYAAALRQVLASRRVTPTANDLADGLQEARLDSGTDAAGNLLFDRLPGWYQHELARRGADVEALVRSIAGAQALNPTVVERAYSQMVPSEFTVVCLRSVVVSSAGVDSGRRALQSRAAGTREDGCAPADQWAADVAARLRSLPEGATASVARNGRVAVILVERRTVLPLAAVAATVKADLSSGYTDLVDSMVEDRLAMEDVTVAPQYGTYESFGQIHDVLPPDALAPASPATTMPRSTPSTPPPSAPIRGGQVDPFD